MFEIGTYVLYGANGVCKIEGKTTDKIAGEEREYYVLAPAGITGAAIMVPADNQALLTKMKEIISGDEISRLIEAVKKSPLIWENDNKKRNELFGEILARADRKDIMLLIRSILIKKKELALFGKKLTLSDDNMLKRAEKLINDEFAVALGIESGAVPDFIREKMSVAE